MGYCCNDCTNLNKNEKKIDGACYMYGCKSVLNFMESIGQ